MHRRNEPTPKRFCEELGSLPAQSACCERNVAPVADAITGSRLAHRKDSWLSALDLSGCALLFCLSLLKDSYPCKLYTAPARSWAEVCRHLMPSKPVHLLRKARSPPQRSCDIYCRASSAGKKKIWVIVRLHYRLPCDTQAARKKHGEDCDEGYLSAFNVVNQSNPK